MKAYALMLVVFMFTASLSFVSNLDLLSGTSISTDINGQSTQEYVDARIITIGNLSDAGTANPVESDPDFSWYNAAYQLVFVGIPLIVNILLDSTILLPFMLMAVGVPTDLAIFISLFAWIIYFFGMVQWITNRSLKQHE